MNKKERLQENFINSEEVSIVNENLFDLKLLPVSDDRS